MTQEEKELLLKDLCGRLPYGTIYDIKIGGVTHLKVKLNAHIYKLIEENWDNGQLQSITPYLRKQNRTTCGIYVENLGPCVDYYNSSHIDYRGLISMGLALEAPEYMYKTE